MYGKWGLGLAFCLKAGLHHALPSGKTGDLILITSGGCLICIIEIVSLVAFLYHIFRIDTYHKIYGC
jgi:hypothetical protein